MTDKTTLIEIGERLQDHARREISLLTFMLNEASPETWAKAAQSPPGAGDWTIAMNKRRRKRAATPAEAREIIDRAKRFCGDRDDLAEFMRHALTDPLWALQNLRAVVGEQPI